MLPHAATRYGRNGGRPERSTPPCQRYQTGGNGVPASGKAQG